MELAMAGTPAGLIGTTAFQGLAVSELATLGVTGVPLLVIEHPLGGVKPEGVSRRARQAVEQLAGLLGSSEGASTAPSDASPRKRQDCAGAAGARTESDPRVPPGR